VNTRTSVIVASALIATATLGACSSTTQGNATGSPSQQDSGSVASNSAPPQKLLAPPVPAPLNPVKFMNVQNICKILNVKQLNAIGLPNATAGGQVSNKDQTACSYFGTADNGMNLSFETVNAHGLSDIYSQKSTMKYWQPTIIQGYPAVAASESDGRKVGTCTINVGVTNQLAFFAQSTGQSDPTGKVGCLAAKKAADQVITTLKTRPNP
jgi:hypothetical protein